MTTGRRKLPDDVKQGRGTARPCRTTGQIIEFPKTTEPPPPPSWLNRDGKTLWLEVAARMHQQGVLTSGDLFSLGHLCQLHGEAIAHYRRKTRPTSADLAQMRLLFTEFGMTPASRTKVKAAGPKVEENAFLSHGRRPENEGPTDEHN